MALGMGIRGINANSVRESSVRFSYGDSTLSFLPAFPVYFVSQIFCTMAIQDGLTTSSGLVHLCLNYRALVLRNGLWMATCSEVGQST